MTTQVPGLERCPKCAAAVKPADPWCTLCYTDLRPAPEPPPPPPPSPSPFSSLLGQAALDPNPATIESPKAVRADPLTAPLEVLSGPTWPCSACGASNPMASDTCSGCGAPFLAGLRGQEAPLLELPVVGDITRLGRGQRYALAAGVVLVVITVTLLLGLLFS